MVHLYQISNDYKKVLEWIEDVEGEPDANALTELLNEVQERFEQKAGAVVAYIKGAEAEAQAFRQEAERLEAHAARVERRVNAMKEYLAMEMRKVGLPEVDAGIAKVKFVKNPWAVDLIGPVPDEYLRQRPAPPPEPDKAKIAEALKAGVQLDFARLTQGERLKIS